jgi:hypothetical protein
MKRIEPIGIAFLAVAYAVMAMLLTCGCSLHVGDAPCTAWARAIESRMTECGIDDEPHKRWLSSLYQQCDAGFLGVTLVDADAADECADHVRAMACEDLRLRGVATCISEVRL